MLLYGFLFGERWIILLKKAFGMNGVQKLYCMIRMVKNMLFLLVPYIIPTVGAILLGYRFYKFMSRLIYLLHTFIFKQVILPITIFNRLKHNKIVLQYSFFYYNNINTKYCAL